MKRARSRSKAWVRGGLVLLALACVALVTGLVRRSRLPASAATATTEATGPHGARGPSSDVMGADDPSAPAPSEPLGRGRLEGQVIDEADAPVSHAIVTVSLPVPRTVRADESGLFHFDGLPEGAFGVGAFRDALVAAPVTVRITEQTAALTLHAEKGVELDVAVTDEDGPVKEGSVLVEWLPLAKIGEGHAHLQGLTRGFHQLVVRTPDIPEHHQTFTAEGNGVLELAVRLEHGATVEGEVQDEEGKPVPSVAVTAEDTWRAVSQAVAGRPTAITDEAGKFRIEGLKPGMYTLSSEHPALGVGRSAALEVAGRARREGVVVRLAQGQVLAGTVIDDGTSEPVEGAEVTVSARRAGGPRLGNAVSGKDGAFKVLGLPKEAVTVVAREGGARSPSVAADLTRAPSGVVLRLDGGGAVGGQVVTSAGEPVGEAQVVAVVEAGDATSAPLTELTDAGGGFTFARLAKGKYRLRVGRGGARESSSFWAQAGTLVATGAKDVRLVLEKEGTIHGRVRFASGGTPARFSVSITLAAGAPMVSSDGSFRLDHVPAGRHVVTVTGDDLAPRTLDPIDIAAGAERDVGDVVVERRRSLRGRVVSGDGRPVAGAVILAGAVLYGDGSTFDGAVAAATSGAHRALSDGDGRFAFRGLEPAPLSVFAEHAELGRSPFAMVAAGAPDAELVLRVEAPGALEGRVVRNGKGVARVPVVATTAEAVRARAVVTSDDTGRFRFPRLARATYLVSAVESGPSGSTQATTDVVVSPGQTAHVDLTFTGGQGRVVVRAPVGVAASAQVHLVSGEVRASSAGELEVALAAHGKGESRTRFLVRGEAVTFDEIEAGTFSLCAVLVHGDVSDPAVRQLAQRRAALLPVACTSVDLSSGGTVEVPLPWVDEKPRG